MLSKNAKDNKKILNDLPTRCKISSLTMGKVIALCGRGMFFNRWAHGLGERQGMVRHDQTVLWILVRRTMPRRLAHNGGWINGCGVVVGMERIGRKGRIGMKPRVTVRPQIPMERRHLHQLQNQASGNKDGKRARNEQWRYHNICLMGQ